MQNRSEFESRPRTRLKKRGVEARKERGRGTCAHAHMRNTEHRSTQSEVLNLLNSRRRFLRSESFFPPVYKRILIATSQTSFPPVPPPLARLAVLGQGFRYTKENNSAKSGSNGTPSTSRSSLTKGTKANLVTMVRPEARILSQCYPTHIITVMQIVVNKLMLPIMHTATFRAQIYYIC
jgi:hypothetical protein